MRREHFLTGLGAATLPLVMPRAGLPAEGTVTTQAALFAQLPKPRAADWTRIILGSGAAYQKQIGAGIENDGAGNKLWYFEMQTGSPGGSCNPSTMRKAYLRGRDFGSLLDTYPLIANIGRTENMVYRYGDASEPATKGSPSDGVLHLLDEGFLYDERPVRVVSVSNARIHVASQNLEAVHVVAEFSRASRQSERLRHVELWHDPRFPFGLARYRATVAGLDPFEMHVYSHGDAFKTLLNMTLAEVRDITRNGTYGQLPQGIGA